MQKAGREIDETNFIYTDCKSVLENEILAYFGAFTTCSDLYQQVENKKLDCENQLYTKYSCELYAADLKADVSSEMEQMMETCKAGYSETQTAGHRCAYQSAQDVSDELRSGYAAYCPEAMGCHIKTYTSAESCQTSSMLVLDQIADYAPDCVNVYGQVMNEDLKAYRQVYTSLGCNAYRVYAYDIDYSQDQDYEIAEEVQDAYDVALSPEGRIYHAVLNACLEAAVE